MENAKQIFAQGGPGRDKDAKPELSVEDILKKTPEDLFREMDTDDSGFIDFDEFKEMLPRLGVTMTEAKAKRYFKTLDSDGSGELGLDEFKAALYACDPNSGNSIGFSPSAALGPKDAFKLFDEDDSGRLDEDEFADVLDYLDIHVSQAKQEKIFKKYDNDNSGYIEYDEFRKAWLHMSDVRGELERRGIQMGKRTPKAVMIRRLEEVLEQEEQMEEQALAQAKLWRDWQAEQKGKQDAIDNARQRAKVELVSALDLAGQVYVFGVGAHGQFSADAARPSTCFKEFERVRDMWAERVAPVGPKEIRFRNIGQVSKSLKKRTPYPIRFASDGSNLEHDVEQSYDPESANDLPGRHELTDGFGNRKTAVDDESEDFRFSRKADAVMDKIIRGSEFGIQEDADSSSSDESSASEEVGEDVDRVTSNNNRGDGDDGAEDDGLGGREPPTVEQARKAKERQFKQEQRRWRSPFVELVCSPNSCSLWGRRVIQVTAGINTAFALTDTGEILAWGGRDQWWDHVVPNTTTQTSDRGHLTTRSQLMLSMPSQMKPWPDVQEPRLSLGETEDEVFDRLKFLSDEYYGVFEVCPHHNVRMQHMENIVLPRISYEQVALSLSIRGFDLDGLNKREMLDVLHEAVTIECETAGKGLMRKFRQTEVEIFELRAEKKDAKADVLFTTVKSIWRPLLRKHKEYKAGIEQQKREMVELREQMHNEQYSKWREQLKLAAPYSARATTRAGPTIVTERGGEPAVLPETMPGFRKLSAGAFHVAGLSSEGAPYTWGDGNYGRLGQGQGPDMERLRRQDSKNQSVVSAIQAAQLAAKANTTRFDVGQPTLVKDLAGEVLVEVDCGFSHSGAVAASGKVFVWGGASEGKLGLGHVSDQHESYCPYPVRVRFPDPKTKVVQVSCGNAHTGAVTDQGHVYMWGCSDSGRLGLGTRLPRFVETPELVRALQVAGVRVRQVACGCTHSVLCTVTGSITEGSGLNKVKHIVGGHVYVAGPEAVLSKKRPRFHFVKELAEIPIKQVAAGYSTTATVSKGGELFTWGSNKGGSIGHSIHRKFVRRPKLVRSLYRVPKNLALGQKTRQSSVYNKRTSDIAVNGEHCGDGESYCIHTQVDQQPFWEVDLGRICIIERICLWNREDVPVDSSAPRDLFSKRLFPCWIMTSPTPFERQLVSAHSQCSAKKKFTKDLRRTVWELPSNIAARYVRVQLETASYLHFAELEVFGTPGLQKLSAKVASVFLGKEVMMAVSQPSRKQTEFETAYIRAVKADPDNALLLRQYPSYFRAWDKHQFCDRVVGCPLDRGSVRCEMCVLKNKWPVTYPPGPNGRIRRLASMSQILLDTTPAPLNWEVIKSGGENIVANMLNVVDAMKGVFSKSGNKLLGRHVARERFNITLHETDLGTDYLLRQFAAMKHAEENGIELDPVPEDLEPARKAFPKGPKRQTSVSTSILIPSTPKSPGSKARAPTTPKSAFSTVMSKVNNLLPALESPADIAAEAASTKHACIACDICDDFEPLQFNPRVCKVCTHLKATHFESKQQDDANNPPS